MYKMNMNYTVLVLAAFNIASAMCWQLTDLECPEDGSDITIDNIGFESRGFRFPAVGTFGFPILRTCKWTFKTQEQGAQIVLSGRDGFAVGNDRVEIFDTNGTPFSPTSSFSFRQFASPLIASGNTVLFELESDDQFGDTEEFSIYVIAARDSNTCPGSSTIQATDEFQIVTSPNFPNNYDIMQDCEITVVGEQNKVIMYTIAFAAIDQYRDSECSTLLEVFDGASTDEKIFDSCNPFKPENTSMITMREAGENLYIKFSSDEVDVDIGFAILFKLKDVDPCAERRCDPNELCFYTRDTYEEECRQVIANGNTNEREISCPEDGTEIILDVPSLESRTFRFPPMGTRGFPTSDTCTWTLRAQPGFKIAVGFRDSTLIFNHVVRVLDGTDTLLELQQGDERSSQDKASSGNSLTLQLDTDSQSSELETFAITVFGGRDSGICPGTQTVQATDSYQILTSEDFPGGTGAQICDVTITADDGNIIVFSMLYASLNFYRSEYNDFLEIYEGTSPKKTLFSVDPFFPALNARTSGNQLRIRYELNDGETGFLFTFKQKLLTECKEPEIPSTCDPNAICSDSNGTPTCECTEGFTGNGSECTAERSRMTPVVLVSTIAGVLGVISIIFVIFLLIPTSFG